MTAPTKKIPVKARVTRRRSAAKSRANRKVPLTVGRRAVRALEAATEKSAGFLAAAVRSLSHVQEALRHAK
jgi:hypothetical protein